MSQDSNLKQAIAELQQTKETVLPLLKDNPMLQLRTQTTIDRLIAGFTSMDATASGDYQSGEPLKRMTTFMGSKISDKKEPVVRDISKSEIDFLKDTAQKIYGTVTSRDSKELLEAIGDVELRAVAKLSGLNWVTSSKPAKLNVEFVDKIKAAIFHKEENEKEKAKLKKLEDRSEILVKLLFTEDDKTGAWSLQDRSITKEQILDDEAFDNFIADIQNRE